MINKLHMPHKPRAQLVTGVIRLVIDGLSRSQFFSQLVSCPASELNKLGGSHMVIPTLIDSTLAMPSSLVQLTSSQRLGLTTPSIGFPCKISAAI